MEHMMNKVYSALFALAATTCLVAPASAQMVNAQTGTSYTFVNADCDPQGRKIVTFSNAAPVAVTLPQAGASGQFLSGCSINAVNLGAGLVTITPTTSTINGGSTTTLAQGASQRIDSTGTPAATGNYVASNGGGGPAAGAFTSITGTITPFPIAGLAAAQGGAVSVTGGTSSTSANAGGAVTVVGGTPGATGVGGAVSQTGGAAVSGNGGAASTVGGAGGGAGVGGAAALTGGLGGATNAVGGAATVTAGAGNGTGNGAVAGLVGGGSGGGVTGTGGVAQVIGGASNATNGNGGASVLTGGAGKGSGVGGAATIAGGLGGLTNATGGAASLTGGAAQGTGSGATASLVGGASGAGGATGNGGAAVITGGASVATNGNGADVTIAGGASTGNGTNASVTMTPGTGGSGVVGGVFTRGLPVVTQGNPTALTTSATLTAAQCLSGILTANQGGGASAAYALPTVAAMEAALPADFGNNDAFVFSLINISTAAAEATAITTGGAGWTLVGDMDVLANSASTTKSAGRFMVRRTSSLNYVIYRLS